MQSKHPLAGILARLLLLTALLTAGCSQAVPAATQLAAAQPVTDQPTAEPSATPLPPTATVAPSATPLPPTATQKPSATATATATATPAPTIGPAAADSLSAWCTEQGVSTAYISDPLQPLDSNRPGAMRDGALEVRNLPAGACVFVYTFNQAVPQGLTLQVYDLLNKDPWLTAELIPVESQPQSAAAILTHDYIVAPPAWDISFFFAVVDEAGRELRRDPVNLHRWEPAICWNGQKPNLVTLRCPLQQDLHPWDAGYGTPMPTPVRED